MYYILFILCAEGNSLANSVSSDHMLIAITSSLQKMLLRRQSNGNLNIVCFL